MLKKHDLIYAVLHIPFDVIALGGAFVLSYWLRGNGNEIFKLPYSDYLNLAYLSIPIWLVLFAVQGLYSGRNLFASLSNVTKLALGVLTGWASFVVYLAFVKTEATLVFPRLMLIYILIFSFLFVFGGRIILRIVRSIARWLGFGLRNMIVFGDGELAESVEANFKSQPEAGTVFVDRIGSMAPEGLSKWLKAHRIDDVIIADHHLGDNQIMDYIIAIRDTGASVHIVPKMFDVQTANVVFSTLAGYPILTFRQTPLEGWGRVVKRVIDFIVSIVGLIVLAIPFLLVALVIWLTDRGPAFYRHTRISRGGQKIEVYKFRSMYLKYCTGGEYSGKSQIELFTEMGREDLIEEFKRDQKVKNDPRVTSIGKFLRKTNVDELPQLINVFRGELSLVGPRPIVEDELARYGRWGAYLLSIKPGMTGLWQVSGRNDITYDERVQLDNQYVQNWSLWQDFVIVIKTFVKVLGGGDGY